VSRVSPRERVWQRFEAADGPVAWWLHAPAGFGKTTAVAGWLQSRGQRAVWYHVDAGDADPATMFGYLARMLSRGGELPIFRADFRLGLGTFANRWFERWWAVAAEVAGGAPVLVFDDYQEAGAEGLHQEVVRSAIDQAPAGGRIFVLSRQAPPPAWARLQAIGRLGVVTASELSLTLDEAVVLARLRDPTLGAAALDRLGNACHGWAAGLVLLMRAGCTGGWGDAPADPLANGESGSATPDVTFDFFGYEVIRGLPERALAVLRVAAWLPVASIDVLAEASGEPCSGEVLESLHRDGTFTLKVDRADAAYQFHPLFQAFLRSGAVQGGDAIATRERRRRAAHALASRGHLEDALEVAIGAQDWTLAAELLRRLRESLNAQGRYRSLLRWLGALPPEVVRDDPWLLHGQGEARCQLADAAGMPDLEAAIALFERNDDHDGMALALNALASALMSQPDADPGRVRPLIPRMIDLHDRWRGSAACRLWLLRGLTTSRWFADPADPRFDGWLAEMRAIAEASGSAEAMALWLHPEFLIALTRGQHDRVRAALRVLYTVEERLREPHLQAFCRFLRVYALNKLGRYKEAVQAFEHGASAAQREGALVWAYQISMHGVEACIGAGRLQQAEALMQTLQQQVPVERGFAAIFHALLAGWLALWRGDLARALAECRRHEAMLATADVALFRTLAPLTLGWVHLARGELDDADASLARAEAEALALASPVLRFDALLGRAEVAHRRRQPDAHARLADALAIGAQHRYVTVYYARPSDLSEVFARALEVSIETAYVCDVIRARALRPPASRPRAWPWPLRIRTFGTFVIERETGGVLEPLQFGAKTPRKLLTLLKALIALGAAKVPESRLLDAVWPELDADQAQAALKVAISRLNQLLGEPGGWVSQRGGLLGLDPERVWLDTWALDRLLDPTEPPRDVPQDAAALPSRAAPDALLALYRGPFLAADLAEPWSVPARERWRQFVVRVLHAQGQERAALGDVEGALRCYAGGFERDLVAEPLAVEAMRLQQRLGRRLDALATFERLREALARELGLRPSAEAAALHRELVQA
jgi:ATP/maltotriose-dependent transcriptional regulator MalT/DNA-binding SARP family transcriptional activator